jgi:hypothetical protein
MIRRFTIIGLYSLAASLAIGPMAVAQQAGPVGPVQPPANYLPNYFNRTSQPLSPYLNLFNGSNPGVNYYYGVRPGLPSGGQPLAGTMGRSGFSGGSYTPFAFQYTALPSDAGQQSPGAGYVLPPAGHLNTYGNYFGIAGNSLPGYGSGRGSANPGIANTRATAPPAKSRGGSGNSKP